MLGTLEHTSVGSILGSNELNEGGSADGVGSLLSANWHGIRDGVKRHVHILFEEGLELLTDEELLRSSILDYVSPDNLLLAVRGQSLVFCGIEVFSVLDDWALRLVPLVIRWLSI